MEGMFNSREVAFGIWGSGILIWALTKKDLRISLYRVVQAAIIKQLVIPVSVLAGYFLLILFLLNIIGFWHLGMLKGAIYWFVLSGLTLFGKAVTESKPFEDWKQTIRDQVSIIVILAFLGNSYTFSIYMEIVLVPVFVVISLLVTYADYHHKNEPVEKLLSGVQVFIGLIILIIAGIKAYNDYTNLASIITIQGLLLPVILATMVVPFMYLIAVYSAYDKIIRMATFNKTPDMASYIKRKLLWSCGLNLKRVRAISAVKPFEFIRANSKLDVDAIIERRLSGESDA